MARPPLYAGQFGGWAPIGAEVTASGYEIAWKIGTTSIRSGTPTATATIIDNAIGAVSGSSSALKLLEPSFHQDLNGDGVIGSRRDHHRSRRLDQPVRSAKTISSIPSPAASGPS